MISFLLGLCLARGFGALTVSLVEDGRTVAVPIEFDPRLGPADSAFEVAQRFIETHGLSSGFGCENDSACAALRLALTLEAYHHNRTTEEVAVALLALPDGGLGPHLTPADERALGAFCSAFYGFVDCQVLRSRLDDVLGPMREACASRSKYEASAERVRSRGGVLLSSVPRSGTHWLTALVRDAVGVAWAVPGDALGLDMVAHLPMEVDVTPEAASLVPLETDPRLEGRDERGADDAQRPPPLIMLHYPFLQLCGAHVLSSLRGGHLPARADAAAGGEDTCVVQLVRSPFSNLDAWRRYTKANASISRPIGDAASTSTVGGAKTFLERWVHHHRWWARVRASKRAEAAAPGGGRASPSSAREVLVRYEAMLLAPEAELARVVRACGGRPRVTGMAGAPTTAATARLSAAAADDDAARIATAAARLALARSPPSASAVRRASQRQQPTTANDPDDGVLGREESDATRGWRTEELRWALRWFGSELDTYGYGDDARAALASRARQDHTESTRANTDAPSRQSQPSPKQEPLPLMSGPWLFPRGEQGGDGEEAQQTLVSWPALFEVAWYPFPVFFWS